MQEVCECYSMFLFLDRRAEEVEHYYYLFLVENIGIYAK